MSKQVDTLESNGAGVRAKLSLLSVQTGFNPREKAKPSDQLVESVKAHGVQNPIHIRADPDNTGKYLIIDGERRFLAAKKAKKKDIPVVPAGDIDEPDALVLSLITNECQEGLSTIEKAKAFVRLQEEGAKDREIARVLGISVRMVTETLKVLEDGVDEIKKGVTSTNPDEKIPTRVAARAATLPAGEQKKLAKKLKGKSTKEGLKEVQAREKQLNQTRRGRKPRKTPIARDAHSRLDMLFYLVMARLKKYPTDERAKAHLEAVLILQGEREILDLYDGNNKAAKKLVTAKTVKELVLSLATEEEHATAKQKRDDVKKKTPRKKVAKKKVAGKKAAIKKKTASKKTVAKKATKKKVVKKKTVAKKKTTKKGPQKKAA